MRYDTLMQQAGISGASLPMPAWPRNSKPQAEVKIFISDELWRSLPRPPFTDEETEALAERVCGFMWQRAAAGDPTSVTARS